MMKSITTLLLISLSFVAFAQIEGKITDEKGEGLIGVNVYIKDTYDGGTTDIEGNFKFGSTETGEQILVASLVGFKTYEQPINLSNPVSLSLQLKEEVNMLTGVTITAGSFEASDEKKSVVLKPLDIAMTAGATADIPGALNALPGTTKNGETGRLFVRGGSSTETQAFIDGVLVQNFYTPTPNGVPSRSRFSPFLFKGTFFSTGGYSAEYGQALSSVLSLNSNDIADETRSDISLMSVGTDVAHTQKWDNGSIYGQVQYVNLDPYNSLIDQKIDWKNPPTSINATTMLRQRLSKNDMLKVYANYDQSGFSLNAPNINNPEGDNVDLTNKNQYVNASYRRAIGDNSTGYVGWSYGKNNEDIDFNDMYIEKEQDGYHVKSYFTTDINQFSLKTGGEVITQNTSEDVTFDDNSTNLSEFNNVLTAGFLEGDYYITNDLTVRAGLRYSHYSLLGKSKVSPRLSMALKTGENSQISGAYGQFHQLPTSDLLIRSQQVSFEKADHYMMSYQRINKGRTLRTEVYYKDYKKLVRFDPTDEFNPNTYNNSGKGFAQGFDLFWRDNRTFEEVDYWISYSYIDTKRNHRDYPTLANPTFAAKHNFSAVYKQFFPRLKSQIGATYSFNSGRPYNDPNEEGFNQSVTKNYHDLSFNIAYLPRPNLIIYASATNLTGRWNVFGYEFEDAAGSDGVFDSRPITQPAKRFLFVGVFLTLTKNKNKNNLDNL